MEIQTKGPGEGLDPSTRFVGAVAERAAREYGWRFRGHDADGHVALRIGGDWTDYDLSLCWSAARKCVEVRCAFALAPPDERWEEVSRLAQSVNRMLHRGVLELRIHQDRGSLIDWVPATQPDGPSDLALIQAMRSAVGTCDLLLFPAFHCVAWAEVTAETALDRLTFGPIHQQVH